MATKRVEHAEVECAAPDCTVRFVPKRSTAKYHSATCARRAARARKVAELAAVEEAKAGTDAEHSLVKALRTELVEARRIDTFEGQVALELARRAVAIDSNLSAFDKLEAARRRALGVGSDDEADPTPGPAEDDDEVTKARAARVRKLAAAGEA